MTTTKDNRKLMIIAILLLTVAMTGTLLGSLAKYVTSVTNSDGAAAAKFGLDMPTTIHLFSDSYTNVQADTDGKKIIAPGTSGQYKFVVTGTSEVAYSVAAGVSVVYSEAWDDYAPLKFSLDGSSWEDLEDFEDTLSTALASETIAPNQSYTGEQTIHWHWPFYASAENDIKDTTAGKSAAAGEDLDVTVTLAVTATQVD